MNDLRDTLGPTAESPASPALLERTKHVTAAAWTGGVSAFFLVGGLTTNPTWPVAVGVTAISAMVATVCYFILQQR